MSTKSVANPESTTATKGGTVVPMPTAPRDASNIIQQDGCGPIQFSGSGDALYERHLIFDNIVDPGASDIRTRYEAVARSALVRHFSLFGRATFTQPPKVRQQHCVGYCVREEGE